VILTETIGNFGLVEGILSWIKYARERLLVEAGRLFPQELDAVIVLRTRQKVGARLQTLEVSLNYSVQYDSGI